MARHFVFCAFIATMAAAQSPSPVQVVYVQGDQIVMGVVGQMPHAITKDRSGKSFPAWSENGQAIAYIESSPGAKSLDRLVVIDKQGHVLARFPAARDNDGDPKLMHYVDRLEWLDDRRVAITGAVNPSLAETIVFDVRSARVVNHEEEDGAALFFSDHGNHFAYLLGSPHFSPEETWRPELLIDDKRVYPPSTLHVKFLSDPAWASTGPVLAVLAKQVGTPELILVIWRADSGTSLYPLGRYSHSPASLFWAGKKLYINLGNTQLSSSIDNLGAVETQKQTVRDPKKMADDFFKLLISRVSAPGASFWCQSCPLQRFYKANDSNYLP